MKKLDIEAKQELLDKFDAKLAKELNTFREGITVNKNKKLILKFLFGSVWSGTKGVGVN